jgi:hypothetical protein
MFTAPVVPREVRNTGNDVVAVAEGVKTVPERRRVTPPGGTTPSQYPSSSSNGSPPHGSLPLEGSAPLQGSAPSSGSASLSHLSTTDGPAPVPDSVTEASTSPHHSSATDRPVPVHNSTAEGSTTKHYPAVMPKITGLTLIAGVATVYAIFSAFHDNSKDD